MAKKGTSKWFADQVEQKVAKFYGGKKSPSSGAAETDQGDVRTPELLIECKHKGYYGKPAQSISLKLSDWEKICDEAWSEDREPRMVLSMYNPGSVLSDRNGMVALAVMAMEDDGGG